MLAAVAPAVLNAGGFYVSPNAALSNYAGRACNPNYFSVAFQNDSYADTAGMAANDLRQARGRHGAQLPGRARRRGRLQARSTRARSSKRSTPSSINQISVELARIRSLDPDALFQFHPGGAGINPTKQFANSGLAGKIKMITPIYSMDDRMLAATGSAGKGFYLSSLWSADLDNPQNKHFVDAFTKASAARAHRLRGPGLRHGQPDRIRPEGGRR